MVNQEIRATNVKVPQGNLEIDAYLAIPSDPGTYPGIVVVQEGKRSGGVKTKQNAPMLNQTIK